MNARNFTLNQSEKYERLLRIWLNIYMKSVCDFSEFF